MKKILLSIALLVLVSFVLFIYTEFNGNPISKYRSQIVLESYLAETYPDHLFRIDKGYYDFKFNEYNYKVTEIGSGTIKANEVGSDEEKITNSIDYHFSVSGLLFPEVRIDGIRTSQFDHTLMERLGMEAAEDILNYLNQSVKNVHKVDVSLQVLQGQFDQQVTWDKSLPLDRPYNIYIALDASNDRLDDVYENAKAIQELLNEAGYDYQRVNINAFFITDHIIVDGGINGYVKYSLGFEKDEVIEKKKIKKI